MTMCLIVLLVLPSRVSVTVQGKVECSGSPMFLKHRYGVGYQLTVSKSPVCERGVVVIC
jgi:ATP-binding cassette subfamily A (ABC1) protein 3